MNGYVIQVVGRQLEYSLFLRTRPTELSGYTRAVEEARVYRTRDGAEQWAAERDASVFKVVPVVLKRKRNGRLIPALEA